MWLIQGLEASSKERMAIQYAGDAVQKNYMSQLVFGEDASETYLGQKSLWSLHRLIKKNEHDSSMAVVEGNILHALLFMRKSDFRVPVWLESETDLPFGPNRAAAQDLKRVEKSKLEYTITTAPDELSDFYHNMYLPTTTTRHQDRALLMDFDGMMEQVRQGACKLLLVNKGGLSVSGVLLVTNEKIPRLWSNGIRDGNLEYWRDGAIAATYLFAGQYLNSAGHRKMHLGRTRSFLSDGLLKYKMKWGPHFAPNGSRAFIIKPLIFSKGLRSFLVHHPFAYVRHRNLSGAIFIGKSGAQNGEGQPKTPDVPSLTGIAPLITFHLDEVTRQARRMSGSTASQSPVRNFP